jgi:cation transport regulator
MANLEIRGKSNMLYNSIDELPEDLKRKLPIPSQELYIQIFNSAWEEYGDPHKLKGEPDRELVAHQIAIDRLKKLSFEDTNDAISDEDLE